MSQAQVPTFVLNRQLLSLKGDLWIDDPQGNHVFLVRGQYVSLRDVHTLVDERGTEYYTISRSLAHVHRTFEIKHGEQIVATIEQALLTFMGDRFKISMANGTELQVQGDWIDRDFHVTSGGQDVIRASRHLLSIRDAYGIQMAPGFDIPLGIAIVVALEQMEMEGRQG